MISQLFTRRPRFALVISIVITLAGLIAMTQLPIAQFPEIVPPQVEVTASYPGAGADVPLDLHPGAVHPMLVVEQDPDEAEERDEDERLYKDRAAAVGGQLA